MVGREGVRHIHAYRVRRTNLTFLIHVLMRPRTYSSYIPKSKVGDPHNLNLWLKVRHIASLEVEPR